MGKEMIYIDASSGISGDMFVAAMLDVGADRVVLERALGSLPVNGFRTEVSRVMKSAIDCCDFSVILDEPYKNHDHNMEYLHDHEHAHEPGGGHTHTHGPEGGHTHTHTHGPEDEHKHTHVHEPGDHHTHEHRSLADILEILSRADLTDGAKNLAEKIFRILAEAEGAVHGKSPDEVHFHEVGAVDSIVDITAASVCMDNLGITDVIIPGISEGSGTVRTQHGILPIPVPAVSAIAAAYGLPLHFTGMHGEFVTPTGAAIAAAVMTSEKLPERFRIRKTGIGAGKRKYELPGMLRVMRIEEEEEGSSAPGRPEEKEDSSVSGRSEEKKGSEQPAGDVVWKLETNLDDCTGEVLGYVMERLFDAGARDVHYSPVFMKKNRPGWQLNVLCDREKIRDIEKIIFEETTAIGIRRIEMERTVLKRTSGEIRTPYGTVAVKKCRIAGRERSYVEYESAAAIAKKEGVPLAEVYRSADWAAPESSAAGEQESFRRV